MQDPLSLILLFVVVTIAVFVLVSLYSRFFAKSMPRTSGKVRTAPPWIRGQNLEAGQEYCHLRADFNYGAASSGARVSITRFDLEDRQNELLGEDMIQGKFDQLRRKLEKEGWKENYTSNDKEGVSYYYTRKKT